MHTIHYRKYQGIISTEERNTNDTLWSTSHHFEEEWNQDVVVVKWMQKQKRPQIDPTGQQEIGREFLEAPLWIWVLSILYYLLITCISVLYHAMTGYSLLYSIVNPLIPIYNIITIALVSSSWLLLLEMLSFVSPFVMPLSLCKIPSPLIRSSAFQPLQGCPISLPSDSPFDSVSNRVFHVVIFWHTWHYEQVRNECPWPEEPQTWWRCTCCRSETQFVHDRNQKLDFYFIDGVMYTVESNNFLILCRPLICGQERIEGTSWTITKEVNQTTLTMGLVWF